MMLRCCPWTLFCDRIHSELRNVYATRERKQLHLMMDVSLGLIGIGIVTGFLRDPEYRRKMGWGSG